MAKNFDPVGFLEAVYDLSSSEQAWLNGLATAALNCLDDGFGVLAYSLCFKEQTNNPVTAVVIGGDLDLHLSLLERMVPELRDEQAKKLFGRLAFSLASEHSLLSDFHQDPTFRHHAHPHGIYDFLGLSAPDPTGSVVVIGACQAAVRAVDAPRRALWLQLGVHVAAAYRLRYATAHEALNLTQSDIVLSADGQLVRSGAVAPTPSAMKALRMAAVAIDHARGQLRTSAPMEAVDIWKALVTARWSLLDSFDADGRRYYVARQNCHEVPTLETLSRREHEVVQLVALGYGNKLAGYALGLAPSTVATHLHRAMTKLGVTKRIELIHLIQALSLFSPANTET
ncbi:MAG: hypothetical protein H0U74_04555 [Bradymonadaceae bacterium]|nr:hypothetical protein [Lujinxingiaceae bacterium]